MRKLLNPETGAKIEGGLLRLEEDLFPGNTAVVEDSIADYALKTWHFLSEVEMTEESETVVEEKPKKKSKNKDKVEEPTEEVTKTEETSSTEVVVEEKKEDK